MVEELGVPYELVPVDYVAKQTRTPAFLAINPNGHVPVIDDDGFTLHESMAINHYLIRKHADSPIAPRGLEEEARCLSWSFWVVTEVEATALTVLMHGAILPAHAWLKRCLDRPACRRIKAMRKAAAADRLPASPATP